MRKYIQILIIYRHVCKPQARTPYIERIVYRMLNKKCAPVAGTIKPSTLRVYILNDLFAYRGHDWTTSLPAVLILDSTTIFTSCGFLYEILNFLSWSSGTDLPISSHRATNLPYLNSINYREYLITGDLKYFSFNPWSKDGVRTHKEVPTPSFNW